MRVILQFLITKALTAFLMVYKRIGVSMNYILKKGSPEAELLSEKDIEIVNSINDTYHEQHYQPFSHILERVFRKFPDKPAVISAGKEYTYSQLKKDSLLCGGAIVKICPCCRRVAMILPKCYEQVVLAVACMYSGITYVPIEYGYPAARLGECIRTSGVDLVITESKCLERISTYRSSVSEEEFQNIFGNAEIVTYAELMKNSSAVAKPANSGYDDIGMIIFTSGSTGKPKGIKIRYGSVYNILECVWRECSYVPSDKLLGVTNICHDLGNYDIFSMILMGGTLIYPENVKDTGSWVKLMKRYEITQWSTVPTLFGMLLDTLEAMDTVVYSLKNILIGGEFVKPDMYSRAKRYLPRAVLYTDGGPTETTIFNICNRVTDEEYASGKLPYGKPMDNSQYFIFDDKLRVVPVNETGVIYNSGDCLAEGYLDDELTAKSFIIHPTMNIRMYNTGDLGCYRETGKIDIFGRIDNQIKISGKRIDLEEIEQKLCQCDKVRSALAAVIGKDSAKSIGVHIISEGNPALEEIRSFAVANLPDYMIPTVWEFTNTFPKLPNGKIDRKSLVFSVTADAKELTDTEAKLIDIEKKLLGISSIGPDEKFFEIGGHSALLVKLMLMIKKELGIEISLIKLMEYPTVRSLSEYLDNGCKEKAPVESSGDRVGKRRNIMKKQMEKRNNG